MGLSRSAREGGFTLVELLVVMIILGLLAAIAIPAFYSQRAKALDADAKAGVRSAETAIETYATDHGGRYTGAGVAELRAIEATLTAVSLTVDSATADAYQLTVASGSGNTFTIGRDASGSTDTACTVDGEGGCPAGGSW